MTYLKFSLITIVVLLCATVQLNAQVIKTPGSSAQVVVNSSMPERGLTKSQVESKFGAPSSRRGPVGDPAIYTWVYSDYSVVFEDNYVIHSVAH